MTSANGRPAWLTAALAAFAVLGTLAIILAILFLGAALLFSRD